MLFGRDAERALIGALLDAARDSRSGALALRGEAGVGKTVLLDDARARAGDMHVLSARGVESESELPFAALHQLLRPALRPRRPRCPRPRRPRCAPRSGSPTAAARSASSSTPAACRCSPSSPRSGRCCASSTTRTGSTPASADALQFVARRLDAEGVVLLFSAREGDVRVFEAPDVPSHVVEGLDDAAAAELLAHAAGHGGAAGARAPARADARQRARARRAADRAERRPARGRRAAARRRCP